MAAAAAAAGIEGCLQGAAAEGRVVLVGESDEARPYLVRRTRGQARGGRDGYFSPSKGAILASAKGS